MASAIPQGRTTVAETTLKAGALKLPSIFMQSLTMVAPGIAALFYTPVVVNQAGLVAPLAYPIAFVIVLLTAIVLAQLARRFRRPAATTPTSRAGSTREPGSSCPGSTSSTPRSCWVR